MKDTLHALDGLGKIARDARRASKSSFHAREYTDADFNDSLDFAKDWGKSIARRSDSIRPLPANYFERLDVLLYEHGALTVLRTLRELLDGQAAGAEYTESFEHAESNDAARALADQLETLILKVMP